MGGGGNLFKQAVHIASMGMIDLSKPGDNSGAIAAANAKAIAEAKAAKDNAASQAEASVANRKRSMARSQSVFTSPLGVGTQAETSRKTLLGQ